MKTTSLVPLITLAATLTLHAEPDTVAAAIPEYKTTSGVSGNLNSVGSDTLNNLMTFWAEGFKALYPNVNIQIEGKGSATAPPALIEGTAQLGPMSRAMKQEELDAFEKKYGHKPTQIKVAVDALAIFVNKDNPIKGLTLTQADGIFSSTRKRGGPDVTAWEQLGLGQWSGRAISLYGRNSASGTYGFFKEHTLEKGDYKTTVKEQPGSSAVVQGVSSDMYGIGYSGIGYATPGVRAVPLGTADGKYAEATYANCLSGDYPLARFLFIYVNRKPGAAMDMLTAEFLKYVISQQGQKTVVKDGYFPIPAEIATESAAAIK
jgi:phosphate transport system substrate-binding protein